MGTIDFLAGNTRTDRILQVAKMSQSLEEFLEACFSGSGHDICITPPSRRSWRIGQTKPVNVHYLFYNTSIQEKAIRLNIQKLRAALLTEGDLVDEGLVTQAEEDSLISLAKAILGQSGEKASLESELERLRALGDQSDFISPEQDSLQDAPEEEFEARVNNPAQPDRTEAPKATSTPQLPDLKRPAPKSRWQKSDSSQLPLFSLEDAAR